VLVLVVTALFVYVRVADSLNENIDTGLNARANDLAALVAGSSGPPDLGSGGLIESEEGFSQILDQNGNVVASTLAPGQRPLTPSEVERATEGSILISDREVPSIEGEARIIASPADSASGSFVVVAGASTQDRSETLSSLLGTFLIGAPIALLLACGLGYLLAGRALMPVEAMRRRAREITLERSGERLPLPRADDEIHQLGATLNEMLERIEASLERERVFVADASHELRGPLAVLRTELDLAGRQERSPEELRAALVSAAEEVDRLSQLAEDLLVIARSDQGRLPITRERIELQTLLGRVRERFARRATERGRRIVIDANDSDSAELDPLRIEQALGNLIENALRHGGGEVRLSARCDNGATVLEVSDQGPGFPDGFESKAFERFTRADEGRTGGGAGLGLAIARAIAVAHGGEVEISDSGAAATTLRITLPR
jgi:two-component system OmpR family sensor kinase